MPGRCHARAAALARADSRQSAAYEARHQDLKDYLGKGKTTQGMVEAVVMKHPIQPPDPTSKSATPPPGAVGAPSSSAERKAVRHEMNFPRLKRLSWWLAGIYLAWSCLVFFGGRGGQGHEWWPIFLYPLIFPWSFLYDLVIEPPLANWLAPDATAAPGSAWVLMDNLAGAYYIIVGTLWFWFLGKMVSRFVNYRFDRKSIGPNR